MMMQKTLFFVGFLCSEGIVQRMCSYGQRADTLAGTHHTQTGVSKCLFLIGLLHRHAEIPIKNKAF